MSTKLPKSTLSLTQFLQRQENLKLYRQILRTIKQIPDETTRNELRTWARSDFQKNKHVTDEESVKYLFSYGKKTLKELQVTLSLSR